MYLSHHYIFRYILYKLPSKFGGGLEYLYMDDSTNGWILSSKIISESGALANTLKPLLDFYTLRTEHFGYLLYNDDPPINVAVSKSFGHSKGVVMLDRQTGVWLSHSTPRFPTYCNRNFWPNNGNVNAQTFLCVTFPYATFRDIGVQLKYIHIYSFDFDLPTTFPMELQCVAQRSCYPKTEPWSRKVTLTSNAGREFISFAKYTRFGDDLYSGLISKDVKKNLYVRTWGNPGKTKLLPSNCSIPYHVYNVKDVQLSQTVSFIDTVDHSKWCVTADGAMSCIADMNRMRSQISRGGGAICTDYPVVGRAFYTLIKTPEPCPSDAQHTEL
ncbi:deoxyribonuclease-2-alpha-like [Acanthochromis polyacanthus]|uniref:deoxyribonuclease-2-alpha-like n=1 Tax=Acanthochromis polyacanthus TaxID=80966 RepID=UPI0022340D40|nr:deoxyribonuclease-2-alpha-like [Acanthochromis polyacanthus]